MKISDWYEKWERKSGQIEIIIRLTLLGITGTGIGTLGRMATATENFTWVLTIAIVTGLAVLLLSILEE